MILPHVEGTKARGRTYHLNLRIPADLAQHYPPTQTHVRGSLKTSDPKVAERAVRRKQVEFDDMRDGVHKAEALREAIDGLPPDQRAIFDEAGSMARLKVQYDRTATARAFLIAGGGITESDLTIADVKTDKRRDVPAHEQDELIPVASSIAERSLARAAHNAELAAFDLHTTTEAKTLNALGANVKDPSAFGLRELINDLAPHEGLSKQTLSAQRFVVDRFIDLHSDLPLADLTSTHLREFADASRDAPAQTNAPAVRGKPFREVLRITKAQDLPRVSWQTLYQHVHILKALMAKAPSRWHLVSNPWRDFDLIRPKGKKSAAKEKPRHPFTGDQVKAILAEAATHAAGSIDRWAPLFAAYQGARIEEIGQLKGCDVFEKDGVLCISITDEGEDQKVKNVSSVRTIPLHQVILDAGFAAFAEARPKDEFLFGNETKRAVVPLTPEASSGRVAKPFGKRFGKRLRAALKISDPRLVFHSFRHRWEDAAEDTDMPQTHRRDLAGRSKKGDSQANYGEGPRMAALKRSLDRIDPTVDDTPAL